MPCMNLAFKVSPSLPIDAAGQLGELVVAQDQVSAVGVLALEGRDDVEELVRAVAAVIRDRRAVRESALAGRGVAWDGGRVRRQASTFLNAGRLPCKSPTTITSDASSSADDAAGAAGGLAKQLGRAADGREDFAWVGHGSCSSVGCVERLPAMLVRGFAWRKQPVRSPVRFERGLPVFVEGFQLDLEIAMAILGADGLDGVAPGRGLAELVFELGDD